jgi:aspartate racemase
MTDKPEVWLGLIGGLGVGATVHYYQELTKAHEARGTPARLMIAHADMERVLAAAAQGDRTGMAEYLAGLVRRLADAGAQYAAVSAVTPHMCAAELAERSPIPLVNLVEETLREIRRRGFGRVALFGSRFTVHSRMFDQLEGVEVVMPRPEEIEAIHKAYFQIVQAGAGSKAPFDTLHWLAHELMERGAEAIVFGGTELALLFNEDNTDFPHVDCARVHVEAMMRKVN